MRAKKLLKIAAWIIGSLSVVLYCLVTFFLFNPFEGSLAYMRDIVPRGVDFYVRKANLAADYIDLQKRDRSADFPVMPVLADMGQNDPGVRALTQTEGYRALGVQAALAEVRRGVQQLRQQTGQIDLLRDFLGQEVQVAGMYGDRGFDGARYCVYARVSWRGKAAHGLASHGFARSEFAKGGVTITDEPLGDHSAYKIVAQGAPQPFFLMRHLDCLMLSNDKALLEESHKLALGSDNEVEPLGTSSHYRQGVKDPFDEWREKVKFQGVPNHAEVFLRPGELLARLPEWRNWPDAKNEDRRNERILAAFFNPKSWLFLSGSLIFEDTGLTALSRLVVNNNKLDTEFQRKLFSGQATQRKTWMDAFFRMVPQRALGAAALRIPAGLFVTEMIERALDTDERDVLSEALRGTRKYKGYQDLVDQLAVNLEPRVGIVMRPNRRSQDTQQSFPTQFPSPFPQWAMVFWVRKTRSGAPRNADFKELINLLNEHRNRFNIQEAFKLNISSPADVAFEFGIPQIPGTGQVAAATYRDFFILGNSGPLIREMALTLGVTDGYPSVYDAPEFKQFEAELHDTLNGIAYLSAARLKLVAQDFATFAANTTGPVDPRWALLNRPKAADRVFNRSYRQFGTKASIPTEQKRAFEDAVDQEVNRMWKASGQNNVISKAALAQLNAWSMSFRAAYLQLVASSNTMDIWARILANPMGR